MTDTAKKMSIEDAQAELDVLQQTLARERVEQLVRLPQDLEDNKKQIERIKTIMKLVETLEAKTKRLTRDLAKSEASVKVWMDKHAELAERLAEKEAT